MSEGNYENNDSVEARSHWEGVHNDEAAQYRMYSGNGWLWLLLFVGLLLIFPILIPIAITVFLIESILKIIGIIAGAIGVMRKTDPINLFGWKRSIIRYGEKKK